MKLADVFIIKKKIQITNKKSELGNTLTLDLQKELVKFRRIL